MARQRFPHGGRAQVENLSKAFTTPFLLVGLVALLPVILLYSGWSYWVFRGKARADIGY
jgi:cytochrome d ubiquinol oxidase subunit II